VSHIIPVHIVVPEAVDFSSVYAFLYTAQYALNRVVTSHVLCLPSASSYVAIAWPSRVPPQI
jgi:hypothetical protein